MLFLQLVGLMCQVTCGIQPSVNAAYREQSTEISVSRTALYNKLNRMETGVSRALVQYTVQQLQPLIEQLGGLAHELLPGYRVRILDGNCLTGRANIALRYSKNF